MAKEKIAKAIESAVSCIEKAAGSKDEKLLMDMLWQASAELEYALFLFSLSLEDNKSEIFPSSLEHSALHTRPLEAHSVLTSAQRMLKEAKELITKNEINEAYKKTWQVREELLQFQEFLEKKRKKADKTT